MARYTQPTQPQPALGHTVVNTFGSLGAEYDTTTLRAADHRHHYSKTAVWNSDESLVMTGTSGNCRILDGTTYEVRYACSSVPDDFKQWSNTNPAIVYGVSRTDREWQRMDIGARGNTTTTLKTYAASDVGLSALSAITFGVGEGSIAADDSGVVLVAAESGTSWIRPFLVTPRTGRVRCYVSSGGGYGGTVSDATISQDGKWILVNWAGRGVDVYDASDCSFSHQLTTRTSHYDACVSSAGDQVVVQPLGSPKLAMYSIEDGSPTSYTVVQSLDMLRFHVSCRNVKRPGWIFVSRYYESCDSTQASTTAQNRIYALKLDGSGAIENYAWDHQPCPGSYETETMAVPSPTGTRVWWKSTWDGTGGLHSFVSGKDP